MPSSNERIRSFFLTFSCYVVVETFIGTFQISDNFPDNNLDFEFEFEFLFLDDQNVNEWYESKVMIEIIIINQPSLSFL